MLNSNNVLTIDKKLQRKYTYASWERRCIKVSFGECAGKRIVLLFLIRLWKGSTGSFKQENVDLYSAKEKTGAASHMRLGPVNIYISLDGGKHMYE